MDFPRNKSFIYTFASMNDNAEDCTLIFPTLPYHNGCDYYRVECVGFYMNYESLDISSIPVDGTNDIGLIVDDFATENNWEMIGDNQYFVCCMNCNNGKSFPPCEDNIFKVKNSKYPNKLCSRVRDTDEPRKIRFSLCDINGKPLNKKVINYKGITHWAVSFDFTPMYC